MCSEHICTHFCFQRPEISEDTQTVIELEDTIRFLKDGKEPGIEDNHAEMLKIDLPTSVGVLCHSINKVCERVENPEYWRKELMVKILEKDIFLSMIIRIVGIILLSTPFLSGNSKSDQEIREEQADIKAGIGGSDQMSIR